jgi:unsaturated chondroitin disaccharide hydrolase
MWDFKLTPSAPRIRDSSAGAVAVCGFQELLKHLPSDSELKTGARQLLLRLCSDAYLDRNEACPGLLKFAMVGAENKGARNAYTSWGDYYLMEALARELGSEINFW